MRQVLALLGTVFAGVLVALMICTPLWAVLLVIFLI